MIAVDTPPPPPPPDSAEEKEEDETDDALEESVDDDDDENKEEDVDETERSNNKIVSKLETVLLSHADDLLVKESFPSQKFSSAYQCPLFIGVELRL